MTLLWRRKLLGLKNTLLSLTPYEAARNLAFSAVGLLLLAGLYFGFLRVLRYLAGVPLIGELLIWKLTAMACLTTFSMVSVSGLLTSLTTLYYSYDLKFLFNSPLKAEMVFVEKSLESVFFSCWMIALIMAPYGLALARVGGYGPAFTAAFFLLLLPFMLLAASGGMAATMGILYAFPSARTRDVVYILSSFSLTLVYGAIRLAQPEKLIRPDAMRAVAEYLHYLQAPTAEYLPSWWFVKAMMSLAAARTGTFAAHAALLVASALAFYAVLVRLSRTIYFPGYSGAQESPMRRLGMEVRPLLELRWLAWIRGSRALAILLWKERKTFFRDVKHWSQLFLVLGLIFVYLFSIRSLPLDTVELKSLVSFLNIGVAGFVLAALGLRFTYPAISLEGRSWWVTSAAPVRMETVMLQKFLFSVVPMVLLAALLAGLSNALLGADSFTSRVSLISLLAIAVALASMGVGFGAIFPMFNVTNIHQIESSLGGFIYMAVSLAYIGATIMIESWPVRMHFEEAFGRASAWNRQVVMICAALWVALNLAALTIPWKLGQRALRSYEA